MKIVFVDGIFKTMVKHASEWRKDMKRLLVVVDMQKDFIDGSLVT